MVLPVRRAQGGDEGLGLGLAEGLGAGHLGLHDAGALVHQIREGPPEIGEQIQAARPRPPRGRSGAGSALTLAAARMVSKTSAFLRGKHQRGGHQAREVGVRGHGVGHGIQLLLELGDVALLVADLEEGLGVAPGGQAVAHWTASDLLDGPVEGLRGLGARRAWPPGAWWRPPRPARPRGPAAPARPGASGGRSRSGPGPGSVRPRPGGLDHPLLLGLGIGLGLRQDARQLTLEPGHLGLQFLHLGIGLRLVPLGLGEQGLQLLLAGLEDGGQGALQHEEQARGIDGEIQELDQEGGAVAVGLAEELHRRAMVALALFVGAGLVTFRLVGLGRAAAACPCGGPQALGRSGGVGLLRGSCPWAASPRGLSARAAARESRVRIVMGHACFRRVWAMDSARASTWARRSCFAEACSALRAATACSRWPAARVRACSISAQFLAIGCLGQRLATGEGLGPEVRQAALVILLTNLQLSCGLGHRLAPGVQIPIPVFHDLRDGLEEDDPQIEIQHHQQDHDEHDGHRVGPHGIWHLGQDALHRPGSIR